MTEVILKLVMEIVSVFCYLEKEGNTSACHVSGKSLLKLYLLLLRWAACIYLQECYLQVHDYCHSTIREVIFSNEKIM